MGSFRTVNNWEKERCDGGGGGEMCWEKERCVEGGGGMCWEKERCVESTLLRSIQ